MQTCKKIVPLDKKRYQVCPLKVLLHNVWPIYLTVIERGLRFDGSLLMPTRGPQIKRHNSLPADEGGACDAACDTMDRPNEI